MPSAAADAVPDVSTAFAPSKPENIEAFNVEDKTPVEDPLSAGAVGCGGGAVGACACALMLAAKA